MLTPYRVAAALNLDASHAPGMQFFLYKSTRFCGRFWFGVREHGTHGRGFV